jgi:hypothetical protein
MAAKEPEKPAPPAPPSITHPPGALAPHNPQSRSSAEETRAPGFDEHGHYSEELAIKQAEENPPLSGGIQVGDDPAVRRQPTFTEIAGVPPTAGMGSLSLELAAERERQAQLASRKGKGHGQAPAAARADDLDDTTVDELKAIAHREKVTIESGDLKADIIRKIRQQRRR